LAGGPLRICSNAPGGDNATISEKHQAAEAKGDQYSAETAASRIRFTGHGVRKNHPGIFKLALGRWAVVGNRITSGDFVIDIKSMELEEEGATFLTQTDLALPGKAKGNFDIDRSQWNMNYRNDKTLGDKFISEIDPILPSPLFPSFHDVAYSL
jgi:hypothetical protein